MMRSKILAEKDLKAPVLLNGLLLIGFVLAHLFQFFMIPSALRIWGPAVLWALVPFVFMNNTLWALLHETVHGTLFEDRNWNLWGGRILGWVFGSPYPLLKTSHLMHHKYNRTPIERSEVWPVGANRWKSTLAYFFNLCGGLYIQEFIFPLFSFLPRKAVEKRIFRYLLRDSYNGKIAEQLLKPHLYREVRREAVLIYGTLFLSGLLFPQGYRWIPILLLGLRALFISALDYVYHYGTPLHDKLHGYNLVLPHWMSAALLHFNYHGVHHRHPTVSWKYLPLIFRAEERRFDASYFSAVAKQWEGPRYLDETAASSSQAG